MRLSSRVRFTHIIPIRFLVGFILFVNGAIIFIAALVQFSHPPATVLAQLQPAIWWGALLTTSGGICMYMHFPRRP